MFVIQMIFTETTIPVSCLFPCYQCSPSRPFFLQASLYPFHQSSHVSNQPANHNNCLAICPTAYQNHAADSLVMSLRHLRFAQHRHACGALRPERLQTLRTLPKRLHEPHHAAVLHIKRQLLTLLLSPHGILLQIDSQGVVLEVNERAGNTS